MYKIAVLTISDRCANNTYEDETGKRVCFIAQNLPAEIIKYEIMPDEIKLIQEKLLDYINIPVDLVLTNGGTGFSQRDLTPEATESVIEKKIPGIPQMMRYEGSKHTKFAYLSRGIAGIKNKTLIINLPGSPKAAEESLNAIMDIIPHSIDMLNGKGH